MVLKALLLLFMCVGCLLAAQIPLNRQPAVPAANEHWGYESDNGPNFWNGSCAHGLRQSPIDLRSTDVDYALLTKMHFVNYLRTGTIKLHNNGHTVMVSGFAEWGENRPFIFGGGLDGKYFLIQIHFHWAMENIEGSEHSMATLHYPVEVHFVHQKDGTQNLTQTPGDGIAVLGVFLTMSSEGTPMQSLEAGMKHVVDPDSYISIEAYQPRILLPPNSDSFYRYEGSLTTPSCDETVIWTLFPEPTTITPQQLQLLRNIKSAVGRPHEHGNFRPTQPVNHRRIQYRSGGLDRQHICSDSRNAAPTLSMPLGMGPLGISLFCLVVSFAVKLCVVFI